MRLRIRGLINLLFSIMNMLMKMDELKWYDNYTRNNLIGYQNRT